MSNKFKPAILVSLLIIAVSLAALVLNINQAQIFQNKAAGGTVDTLNFFVSKHAIGVNPNPQASSFTQIIGQNSSYYVKGQGGRQYEYHTWDANYIYLKQDTSPGTVTDPSFNGKVATSYRFSPGIWMKRQMAIGESFPITTGLTWYDDNCQPIITWPNYSYIMTLESEIPNYPAGGTLGNQDVIVLAYNRTTKTEKFFYSKEWGWIHWEQWDNATHKLESSASMNNTNAPLTLPVPKCGNPTPPYSLHKECRNNACTSVLGSGKDNCPNNCKGATTTATPSTSPTASPTSAATPAPTQATSPSESSNTTCQGNPNPPAQCFDCKIDNSDQSQINILDFSCFAKFFGQNVGK